MKPLYKPELEHLVGKIKADLNSKQDKLTAGENVVIANNTISATDTVYDDTAVQAELGKKADKTYVDNKVKTDVPANAVFTDTKYSAGTNVSISGTTISATDTKYSAGTNVSISGTTISATDTKTTINGKTGAIAKADIVALGIPAQDTKVVTSATEPSLETGDQWHKEI